MVVSMAITTMSRLLVTFYRHRTRPGVIAVSPVSTNLVFPEPDNWELERQDIINTDRVGALAIASWSQADRARQRAKTMPIPGLRKNGADTIARPPRASSFPRLAFFYHGLKIQQRHNRIFARGGNSRFLVCSGCYLGCCQGCGS